MQADDIASINRLIGGLIRPTLRLAARQVSKPADCGDAAEDAPIQAIARLLPLYTIPVRQSFPFPPSGIMKDLPSGKDWIRSDLTADLKG